MQASPLYVSEKTIERWKRDGPDQGFEFIEQEDGSYEVIYKGSIAQTVRIIHPLPTLTAGRVADT